MVLTGAQIPIFFEDNNVGLAIPTDTVTALQAEGISDPGDLAEFDKDSIHQIAATFCRANPIVVFGAKSQNRMIAACDLMKYYELVDRPLTVQNIRWNIIKSHQSQ